MRLRDEEWLHIAERLNAGASTKVRHTCGNSPSLSIRRTASTLSAHCYRCKAWGRKQLEHRAPRAIRNEVTRASEVPTSFRPLEEFELHLQTAVHHFLSSKGIDPCMTKGRLWYSEELDRVGFKQNGSMMARALHPDRFPKWALYGESMPQYVVGGSLSDVVLVEDILSALKVNYATGRTTVAVLGTSLKAETKLLLSETKTALVMLDGDPAGRKGSIQMLREVRFLGANARIALTPRGLDPKDLTLSHIRSLIPCPTELN